MKSWIVIWLLCGVIGVQGHTSDVARVCGLYPAGWRLNVLALTGPAILAASLFGDLVDPEFHLLNCRVSKP